MLSLRHEVFFHVLFSTKGRRQTIPYEIKERLWTYIESICNANKISVHAAGGAQNHVHLLIEPPPELSLEEIVLKIQATSSEWMNSHVDNFAWQEGYGACSISKSDVKKLVKYIENQVVVQFEKSRRMTIFPVWPLDSAAHDFMACQSIYSAMIFERGYHSEKTSRARINLEVGDRKWPLSQRS